MHHILNSARAVSSSPRSLAVSVRRDLRTRQQLSDFAPSPRSATKSSTTNHSGLSLSSSPLGAATWATPNRSTLSLPSRRRRAARQSRPTPTALRSLSAVTPSPCGVKKIPTTALHSLHGRDVSARSDIVQHQALCALSLCRHAVAARRDNIANNGLLCVLSAVARAPCCAMQRRQPLYECPPSAVATSPCVRPYISATHKLRTVSVIARSPCSATSLPPAKHLASPVQRRAVASLCGAT